MGHPETKEEARLQARALRARLPEAERARASDSIGSRLLRLPELAGVQRTFIYLAQGTEVNTRGCVDALLGRGIRIRIPRIVDSRRMIAVPFPGWAGLIPGVRGIPTSASSDPDPVPPEVVVTPGLAFTPSGDRLGYGGGYYDRWFQENPGSLRVALAFEAQILDRVPTAPGDVPVDMVVTEARVLRTARRILRMS